jgi:hypothetical protein
MTTPQRGREYRQAQIAAGKCSRGCGRPRLEERTVCQPCAQKLHDYRRGERVVKPPSAKQLANAKS